MPKTGGYLTNKKNRIKQLNRASQQKPKKMKKRMGKAAKGGASNVFKGVQRMFDD